MDMMGCLLLCKPIKFHNVCSIYPIDVGTYVENDDYINGLYIPYVISHDIVDEKFRDLSIFEIIMFDEKYRHILIESLKVFCKTDDVRTYLDSLHQEIVEVKKSHRHLLHRILSLFNKILRKNKILQTTDDKKLKDITEIEIYIGNNQEPLTKHNFDELADIIILSGSKQKIKPENISTIPKFETKEGYERWLQYQERRKNSQKKEDTSIASIINIVQVGTTSYIPENIIQHWSMWKLLNSYTSIINRDNYSNYFQIYTQTGCKDLIKEHWSELLKVK